MIKLKHIFLVIACLFVASVFSQEKRTALETAKIIANRIISETPYTFVNKRTGDKYTNLKGVPFSMDVKVSSKYNDWHYTNGVMQIAMLELAQKTGDRKYVDYVQKNMNFVFDKDNYAFFKRQFDESFKIGGWKSIRKNSWCMIFRNKRLDDNGPMGASLIELQQRRPDANYLNYINKTKDHLLRAEPRLSDGTIARLWPHVNTVWADDSFMAISFLCRMGKMTGDIKFFNDAVNQVFNYDKYLWCPEKEIYYHCYHTDVNEHGVAHWSRANGWMLMAQADLLTMLPKNHPKRQALIANFNKQVQGLLHYQGKNGLWHQLLDKPDSYDEITGTAMFVFGIARGVREGWINKDFIYAAEMGLKGMLSKISETGDISAICVGTGIMPSTTFYYNRPMQINGAMGEGPVLRALIEMSYAQKYTEIKADDQYDKIVIK